MAKNLKLPVEVMDNLNMLVSYHDIENIGISNEILFKEKPLTFEEIAEIKRHSDIGYRIARSSNDMAPIAEYILKHHERWDGKGYPIGLKEEEIPLECRIFTIIDAFEEMTFNRPYRKALPLFQAIEEIKKGSGTQFDPALTDVFIETIFALKEGDKVHSFNVQ
jgi:HD-GYP domain-containing protein (c-di-GMP phosphodiesterase class II)